VLQKVTSESSPCMTKSYFFVCVFFFEGSNFVSQEVTSNGSRLNGEPNSRLPHAPLTLGIRLTETDRFGSSVIRLIRLPANLEPIGSSENSEPRPVCFG
jgi:hypothetical protein